MQRRYNVYKKNSTILSTWEEVELSNIKISAARGAHGRLIVAWNESNAINSIRYPYASCSIQDSDDLANLYLGKTPYKEICRICKVRLDPMGGYEITEKLQELLDLIDTFDGDHTDHKVEIKTAFMDGGLFQAMRCVNKIIYHKN